MWQNRESSHELVAETMGTEPLIREGPLGSVVGGGSTLHIGIYVASTAHNRG